MAPSTARSRSWRPCTSEQTPILTEHHSDLLHSKVGLFRLTAVGHPRTPYVQNESSLFVKQFFGSSTVFWLVSVAVLSWWS
jgi:hypothetical protein